MKGSILMRHVLRRATTPLQSDKFASATGEPGFSGALARGRQLLLNPVQRHNVWGVLFALPATLLFAIFAFYPMFQTFLISLTRYNLLSEPEFVGVANYLRIVGDQNFLQSATVTLIYVFASTVITLCLSLSLALLMNADSGREWLRTIYFLPTAISLVVVAILGRMVFQPRGLMFALTSVFSSTPVPWLNDGTLALGSLISVRIWRTAGYFMIFFLAGLQNIPRTYYEVADMDGASIVQRFLSITWPLLKPTTVLVLVTSMINGLKDFTVPHVMTGGAPAGGTRILSILIYENAFEFLRMGRASALSAIMFTAVMLVTLLQLRLFRVEE